MDIVSNIRSMLSDSTDGSVSSKRVIVVLAFILCAIAFLGNLFWSFKIDEFLYNSMIYIVIGGMGFTGLEKFAPKK